MAPLLSASSGSPALNVSSLRRVFRSQFCSNGTSGRNSPELWSLTIKSPSIPILISFIFLTGVRGESTETSISRSSISDLVMGGNRESFTAADIAFLATDL